MELQESIHSMIEQGIKKEDMVCIMNYDYAQKKLKDTNDILQNPIKEFKTVYGIDCVIIRNFIDKNTNYYVITKKYWEDVKEWFNE